MQSMKETAANIAASAKAGMEKTRATVQEKVEKMTAHHPTEKEMATEKKEERINQAERHKQEMKQSAKVGGGNTPGYHTTTTTGTGTGTGLGSGTGTGTASYSTTGAHGQPTGAHQMSAFPGHGTGQPTGQVVEGVAASHPIGKSSGTGHVPAYNTRVGGNPASYGTGGTYS